MKDNRLHVNVSGTEKEKFQRAADKLKEEGLSDLSAFVRMACHKLANKILSQGR